MRDEDGELARRLSSRPAAQAADAAAVSAAVGERAGFISPGVGAVWDLQPSEQKALEQAMRSASSIVICGIAPRSLVEAMQRIAKQARDAGSALPWQQITYVTPSAPVVFATGGEARLGSVVQKWQSALNGIRNCARQLMADAEQTAHDAHAPELSFLGVTELFLEVVLITREQATGKERLWVSIGPSLAREETVYLVFDQATLLFEKIGGVVDELRASAKPIVTRQVDVSPEGVEEALGTGEKTLIPRLEVRSLPHFGAHVPPPSCTPAAITVLRSASAGKPILLLKRRTRFTDADDFDKLSLLSGRVLEEDLAGAFSVPLFASRSSDAALDAMWKMRGKADRLVVPLDAFIRAAQRDVFLTCGLDIAADRFVHLGCHFIEREQPGMFLFFCIFEVVLYRHKFEDELELAEAWNSEQLERVNQDLLYSATYKPQLNRLLLRRQSWLEEHVFSKQLDLIEDGNDAFKAPSQPDRRSRAPEPWR